MKNARLIGLIIIIAVSASMVGDIYLPALPAIAHYFSLSHAYIELTVSFFFLGLGSSIIIYGPLSDHIGRKKVILAGFILALFTTIYFVFHQHSSNLMLIRFLLGFGMGATMLFKPMIRDCFNKKQLSIIGGYVMAAFSIMSAVVPITGGALQQYFSWQAVFYFKIVFLSIITLVVFFFLRETLSPEKHPQATNPFSTYLSVITNKKFMLYACCSGIVFSGFIAYLTIGPFLFEEDLGLSPLEYGRLSLWIVAALSLASLLNHFLVKKLAVRHCILIGMITYIAGAALLLISYHLKLNSASGIMPFLFISFVGMGITCANSLAAAFAQVNSHFGYAGALFSLIQSALAATASTTITLYTQHNQGSLAILLIILGCISLLLWHLVRAASQPSSAS